MNCTVCGKKLTEDEISNYTVPLCSAKCSMELYMSEGPKDTVIPTALEYDVDFSGLKEVPEDSIEAKLYQIIDDIDTAGDMFKPKMTSYIKYTYSKMKEAQKLIVSDGYKLYYVDNK